MIAGIKCSVFTSLKANECIPCPAGTYDDDEEWIDCGFNLEGERICEDQDGWDDKFGNGKWKGNAIFKRKTLRNQWKFSNIAQWT